MTDENDSKSAVAPADVSAPKEEPATSSAFGVPLEVFVRGGTTSMRHDALMRQQAAEDEARRKESDEEKRLVQEEGAKMYSHNIGTPQQHPVVKLMLVNPGGTLKLDRSKPIEILADVVVDFDAKGKTDMSLIMACPYCWSNGVALGRCQFKILQSNRFWALDPAGVGELVVFDGQAYQSAGTVCDSEKIKCPQCSWTFKIDKNRIYEERSG